MRTTDVGSDSNTSRPADPDLILQRHDRLRRTAPAVQHEINNALMVLGSNLELLGRHVPEGPPRRQLGRAQEAIRRLESTMRGFLDAARRPPEDVAAISPEIALRDLLPLLRVALGARFGFELEPCPSAIPPVRLDRGRFELALVALVRDASERMASGARIHARVEMRGREVALRLNLPPGAAPQGDTAILVSSAATATAGRLDATEEGLVLVWPRD